MISDNQKVTIFENLVDPLDIMVSLIYKRELSLEIPELFNKYREMCFQNQFAIDEIEDLIKSCVQKCLSLLSKKYMKQLSEFYNNDGIIYYIYIGFHTLIMSEIEALISSIPPTK